MERAVDALEELLEESELVALEELLLLPPLVVATALDCSFLPAELPPEAEGEADF